MVKCPENVEITLKNWVCLHRGCLFFLNPTFSEKCLCEAVCNNVCTNTLQVTENDKVTMPGLCILKAVKQQHLEHVVLSSGGARKRH